MKVYEIMTRPVITVREDTPLEEVARILVEHGIGGLPVLNEQGKLCGIITDSDFTAKERGFPFSPFSMYRHPQVLGQWMPKEGVEQIYRAARTMPTEEIMSRDVNAVAEDDPVEEVLNWMLRHEIHRVPVVRDREPVGIITRRDLLRMMLEE